MPYLHDGLQQPGQQEQDDRRERDIREAGDHSVRPAPARKGDQQCGETAQPDRHRADMQHVGGEQQQRITGRRMTRQRWGAQLEGERREDRRQRPP